MMLLPLLVHSLKGRSVKSPMRAFNSISAALTRKPPLSLGIRAAHKLFSQKLRMVKDHRLLQPSFHGHRSEVIFDHPLCDALFDLPKVVAVQGTGNQFHFDWPLKNLQAEGDFGTVFKPDVAALLEAAVPSPFGKGEETVFDETVRKGKELNAEALEVLENIYYLPYTVKRKIVEQLFPQTEQVSLRFYKLAIYEEGGHFDFHRDTTHAANHHATLLVEVKSAHKGGALTFEVDGRELPGIDFSVSEEDEIAWIAFYTDVRHKVEPVTKGTRIVLQYDVLVGGEDGYRDEDDEVEKIEPYLAYAQTVADSAQADEAKLTRVLSTVDQAFMDMETGRLKNNDKELPNFGYSFRYNDEKKPPKTLALPLFHFYRSESIRPIFLKGVDRELFHALLKTCLYDIALSPMIMESESHYSGGSFFPKGCFSAVRCDPVKKIYTGVDKDGRAMERIAGSAHVFNAFPSKYIVSHRESSRELDRTTSNMELTGNEALPGEFKYFLGTMLVSKKEPMKNNVLSSKKTRNQEAGKEYIRLLSCPQSSNNNDND